MNALRQYPWIGLVILFSLPVMAWTVFIILARQNPALPLPKEIPPETSAKP